MLLRLLLIYVEVVADHMPLLLVLPRHRHHVTNDAASVALVLCGRVRNVVVLFDLLLGIDADVGTRPEFVFEGPPRHFEVRLRDWLSRTNLRSA